MNYARKLNALLLSVIALLSFTGRAQLQRAAADQRKTHHKYAARLRVFEDFVLGEMATYHVPGMTIGFMKDDFIWVRGFGYADLENKVPAKANSSYRAASITKPMTAVAILKLAEKGKIKLDAEVQTYVPYFPRKKWPITVGQLLGHLGGLRHNNSAEKVSAKHMTTKESVDQFANADLVAEPGTSYNYSTPGYTLLGAVIEGATGQPYADYMRENIWKPLGMNDTTVDDPSAIIPNRVRGYQLVNGKVKNSEFVDVSNRFGAGGVRTTVVDLLKFARVMKSTLLLSKETVERMTTSMTTRGGKLTDYGMGWFIDNVNGHFGIAASGSQQETRTALYIFPTENFVMAAMMNFEDPTPSSPLPYLLRLFQLIFEEPAITFVHTGSKATDTLYDAMDWVLYDGLSYFERYRQPITTDPKELSAAFSYFNHVTNQEALRASSEEVSRKIDNGHHPSSGQPFGKLGSFMAAQLSERFGRERIKQYHTMGAITFFYDFNELLKEQKYADSLRFEREFAGLISAWNQTWNRTNTEFVRRLWISPDSNLDEIDAKLRKTFAGADIYPNVNRRLSETAWRLILKGERERGAKAAQLAVDLYPQSDLAHTLLAIARITLDQKEQARTLLRRAAEIAASRDANVTSGLIAMAYDLSNADKLDAGLNLLELSSELYPREANLYVALGEFYLLKGQKQKAVEHYRKALTLNPKLERVKQMLKELPD